MEALDFNVTFLTQDGSVAYDTAVAVSADSLVASSATTSTIAAEAANAEGAEPEFSLKRILGVHRMHMRLVDGDENIVNKVAQESVWGGLPPGTVIFVSSESAGCLFCVLGVHADHHAVHPSTEVLNYESEAVRTNEEGVLTDAELKIVAKESKRLSPEMRKILERLKLFADKAVTMSMSSPIDVLHAENVRLKEEAEQWRAKALMYLPALRDRDSRMLMEYLLGDTNTHDQEQTCATVLSGDNFRNVDGGRIVPRYRDIFYHLTSPGCQTTFAKTWRKHFTSNRLTRGVASQIFSELNEFLHVPGEDASFPPRSRAVRLRDDPFCRTLGGIFKEQYNGSYVIVVKGQSGQFSEPC